LIGLADRFWNRDHPWRRTLTEAVFPFYIIHQTIIVVTGWYLLRFALPPTTEFAALLAATVTGCWLFYFGGREIGWLRPLIGLRPLAQRPRSATEAASIPGVP
jgi:peptidoglycan/LPS O-acetylase OafA/YrhL